MALIRKLVNDDPQSWHVFYDGVRVGGFSHRPEMPQGADTWAWHVGFYPGPDLKDQRHGTADTMEQAKDRFEAAWLCYLPRRTAAEFQEHREHARYTAAKYAAWDANKRLG